MRKKNQAPAMLDKEPTLKLDYQQTFRVGLAFAIIIMFWNAYDFVVPLLLEHAYGLSDTMRGLIMGLDNLLSLFMLPLFGKLSDKSNGKLVKKYGRRTPFIVIGTLAALCLMIFVPVATLGQQRKAMALEDDINTMFSVNATEEQIVEREEHLNKWFEDAENEVAGSKNYLDIEYLRNNKGYDNGENLRTYYVSLAFDPNLTSKKAAVLFGAETFYYNGVEVSLDQVDPSSGLTYQEIKERNEDYKKFVAPGVNTYRSEVVRTRLTNTPEGAKSIGVYMVILLLVLIAMGSFRSPAVALMPDVTPKPLRSQANAIINLMGGLGGAVSFLIYTIALFKPSINSYVIIFGSVAAGMLLFLAGFLALVNERKMVKHCEELCAEFGIDQDDEPVQQEKKDGNVDEPAQYDEIVDKANEPQKKLSPIARWKAKPREEKRKNISFILILASIFMWFMGYNAITSNLSIYITKALNLSAGIASIINGVSMAISAIAFLPVGYLAAAIGRRKTVILGYMMSIVSFLLIFFVVNPNPNVTIPAALFATFYLIAGFGLIIVNVNTFPMVTELSTPETVGQYTGYYYMATMSAQAITPFFVGFVMEKISNRGLFIYAAIFVALAIIFMLFVRHGDSKPIKKKGKKMTKEEHKQLILDSMNDAD